MTPDEIQRIKDKYGTPVTFPEWRKRYSSHATATRAFLTYLRRARQDIMTDGSIPEQLRCFVDGFQEQADRFRREDNR